MRLQLDIKAIPSGSRADWSSGGGIVREHRARVAASLRNALAFLALPWLWRQRAAFRAELLADLRERPDFLEDIGIGVHEAQVEAVRFFWEPTWLTSSRARGDCSR
ncbi:hypothetical protein [Bradyrhizobium betae]|uniref:hypothetical protein n=1 Tax=Bradyrhizobium betae TaxID=244734 RepID=UPI00100EE536|nr:hypothetical protein [Bradyrhizobium betae]